MSANEIPVDWEQSRCLCDVGMPGWLLIEALAPDGERHLLMADEAVLGDEPYDRWRPRAPHEELGPLPASVQQRLAGFQPRCGRTTKSTGRGCRTPVARPGAACSWHRAGEGPWWR
jgi:hypothetical protein